MMSDLTIGELSRTVSEFVKSRSWEKYHNPRDIAIAISVESAELLELFKWKGKEIGTDSIDIDRVKDEVADVVIYALALANSCGFDLGEAVQKKMSMNEQKYPPDGSKDLFG